MVRGIEDFELNKFVLTKCSTVYIKVTIIFIKSEKIIKKKKKKRLF